MKTITAIYPGSFDPLTNGHLDLIERGGNMFDRLIVAILRNPDKQPLFSIGERKDMLQQLIRQRHWKNVEVDTFSGLLVDYARARGIATVVKGLRGEGDLDSELKMAQMNRHLGGVETFFLATSPPWSFISSSLIKEVVRFGGDVSGLVPPFVRDRLEEKLTSGGD